MRATASLMSVLIIGLVVVAEVAMADEIRKPVPGGTIVIPESSIPKPGQGHTNVQLQNRFSRVRNRCWPEENA